LIDAVAKRVSGERAPGENSPRRTLIADFGEKFTPREFIRIDSSYSGCAVDLSSDHLLLLNYVYGPNESQSWFQEVSAAAPPSGTGAKEHG